MSNPPRKTIRDFDPDLLGLFDQFVYGRIERRGFIAGAAHFAIGATVADSLPALLIPQIAMAKTKGNG